MSFGHTLKKFLIQLNDKLDDPNAKAWDPTLTGKAALQEQWRWTELAAEGKRDEWRKIIQRTDGWREREKEQAEATAAANRARRGATARNRAPRAAQAGNGCYAAVPPPPPPGVGNARDARAARRAAAQEQADAARSAAREQADQQQGGYWGDWD